MSDLKTLLYCDIKPLDEEPDCDIAICSTCGFQGKFSQFEVGHEGSWEEGYYDIHLCPKCEDGGCVDDYTMSNERHKEWQKWAKRKGVI